ncbi:hypothetical protein ACTFIV_006902 [Dictyostelium citrinum]
MQTNAPPGAVNIEELLNKIENVVLKNPKNKESLDTLKLFYKICLNYSGKNQKFLSINSTFIEKLTTLLLDPNAPFKIKLLTLSTLSKFSKNEHQILYKSLKTFDPKSLPLILSLLLSTGTDSQIYISSIPFLVQSISSQDPITRSASMPSLAISARYHSNSLTNLHIKPIETQLIQFLSHASLISDQKQTSTGFFSKISNTSAIPVTELDGSVSIEFFTVLNNSTSYTEDQTFNIYSFSILYTWLINLYKINKQQTEQLDQQQIEQLDQQQNEQLELIEKQQQQQQRTLSQSFHNTIVSYCLRLIDQSKLKPIDGSNNSLNGGSGNFNSIGGSIIYNKPIQQSATAIALGIDESGGDDLSVMALLESIRILDYLCLLDSNLIAKIFPTVQKAYQLHLPSSKNTNATSGHILLALLQFFVNHSHTLVYDPEPLFKVYFQTYLPRTYMNSFVSFETINFCLKNKQILLKNSNVFNLYFPPIFKCLAWFPNSLSSEFSELLPSFISSNSFIEVFHLLLDLPLLTLSMESVLVEQRKYASMGIEHNDVGVDTAWSEYRVLYNYLLRNESGVNINFWSTTTLPLLQQFCKKNPVTPRSIGSCELVPLLLDIYFDVLLEYGSLNTFITLLPVIFERMEQIFPYEPYQKRIRDNLMSHLLSIFKKHSTLILSEKQLILSVISEARMTYKDIITLSLSFIIGEYCSPYICPTITSDVYSDYHEALELITYEKINTIKMESLLNSSQSSLQQSSFIIKQQQQQQQQQQQKLLITNNDNNENDNDIDKKISDIENDQNFINNYNLNYNLNINVLNNINNFNLNNVIDNDNNSEKLQEQYNINIMLNLISSLTKIASRWPDATSRVVLCLMKIISYQQYFNPQIIQRANESISLLKYPSFAAALYNCQQPQNDSFHSTISSSTIGQTIQDCNSSLSFLLNDTLNYKSKNTIHPFILK